jgi:hypothetical protein
VVLKQSIGLGFSPALLSTEVDFVVDKRSEKKTKKAHVKMRDLAPRKDSKGGTSAPNVPASLQDFLKRDSVPIAPRSPEDSKSE